MQVASPRTPENTCECSSHGSGISSMRATQGFFALVVFAPFQLLERALTRPNGASAGELRLIRFRLLQLSSD